MKNLLPIALFLGTFNMSWSQITITSADMPASGDTVIISTTQDAWSIDATISGANQTWDYSFLTPLNQRIDTLFSITSLSFVYQLQFANPFDPAYQATYAQRSLNFDLGAFGGFVSLGDIFSFYKVETNGLKNVGVGANVELTDIGMKADTIETVYEFPMNYGNQDTSVFYGSVDISGAAYYEQYRKVRTIVEGWGTLITPFGTFDVLKLKKEIEQTDSVYVYQFMFGSAIPRPLTVEYHWIANGQKVPLLKITEVQGAITSIEYRDANRGVGISQQDNLPLWSVYPNPANDIMHINGLPQDATLQIFTIDGKQMMISQLNSGTLDVSGLPSGMYILEAGVNEVPAGRMKVWIGR